MFTKEILFLGQKANVTCDKKCEKAWGLNSRPKIQLDPNNEEDFAWLSDGELGIAPTNPGTYEGGHAKPTKDDEKLNRWCVRECERCSMTDLDEPIKLKDFSKRYHNYYWRNEQQDN